MEGRTIGGKYSLERELARGGMGAVWAAFDGSLRRRVALKLMSPDHLTSQSARSRFEREAMAIAQLQSPNVVQIYDYGIDGDAPYIVMELLEGEDLQTRLTRLGKLPLPAVASILSQAGRALTAAHERGIVHRDIKPANIFLARHDGDEIVKVLDFGVAALVSGLSNTDMQVTRAGGVVGTPHYMSPEQVRGSRAVDLRSDLWSLGVVAYRAITGRLPLEAEAFGELLIQICTDPIPPPSKLGLGPEIGPEADRFFEKALARDPARRFASAREMAAAFATVASDGREGRTTQILVVDDEPDVALLMKQRFRQQIRKRLFDFVFAGDGEAALEQMRACPDIEIALTDINMPGMDGLTFLRRAGELNPLVKVVVVSAYSDMSNIREAMNRGAFDFLVKPIDFKDLEVTIDKTVKHAREVRRTLRSSEENNLLRMFVNTGILERLLPAVLRADGSPDETIEATVAFVDVHGFTTLTRNETAESALRTLNANFEIIVPEITARGGVVDKFVGDAVMAVFRDGGDPHTPGPAGRDGGDPHTPGPAGRDGGDPHTPGPAGRDGGDPHTPGPAGRDGGDPHTPGPAGRSAGHLARALDACIAVKAALADLAARTGARSPYAHGVSIGVDSGAMICGSIGSRVVSRLDYTVLGDVVNDAARLQQLPAAEGRILVSERVRDLCAESFECVQVSTVALPSRPEPVPVFNVVGRSGASETPVTSAETVLMDSDVSHDDDQLATTPPPPP